MYMAKVIGSVVSTQKDKSLIGKKLMIVQPINDRGESIRYEEVATDTVGAGIGEYVLIVKGSGARTADGMSGREGNVNDCSIVGIIDTFDK